MKLSAEDQKKAKYLAVLGTILLGAVYYSFFSGPSIPSSTPSPAALRDHGAVDPPTIPTAETGQTTQRAPGRNASRSQDFHPVLHPKRKEDQVDPTTIDPTIKLYILAKLQEVPAAGGGRNLFQFGAPAPKPAELKGPEPKVHVATIIGPPVMDFGPKPTPPPPPPPPPAPFNAKYYGLATSSDNGRRRAFFLDGDDIIIRAEGETVKGHFRIVKIGVTSVVVEDTDNKRQQTVPIAEEAQG